MRLVLVRLVGIVFVGSMDRLIGMVLFVEVLV